MSDFREYCGVDFSREFLIHYGVGHDQGGHSGRYPWGSGKNPKQDQGKSRSILTQDQKRMLKLGASIAATALIAYGGYKLTTNPYIVGLVQKGMDAISKAQYSDTIDITYAKKDGTIVSEEDVLKDIASKNDLPPNNPAEPVLGIHNNPDNSAETKLFNKITGEESNEESIAAVNPHFADGLAFQLNCGNCALAMELRRRGYDVVAKGNVEGMTMAHIGQLCKNLKSDSFCEPLITDNEVGEFSIWPNDIVERGKKVKDVIEKNLLRQYPPESRGTMFIPMLYGSHWVSWEIDTSGKVNFINSQIPDANLIKDCFGMYNYSRNNVSASLTAIRLDNIDFNDSIKNLVQNRPAFGDKPDISDFDVTVDVGNNFTRISEELSDAFAFRERNKNYRNR